MDDTLSIERKKEIKEVVCLFSTRKNSIVFKSLVEMLINGWDFDVDAWSIFLKWNLIKICVELVWTLRSWTQPSGPLCLWQCFNNKILIFKISKQVIIFFCLNIKFNLNQEHFQSLIFIGLSTESTELRIMIKRPALSEICPVVLLYIASSTATIEQLSTM